MMYQPKCTDTMRFADLMCGEPVSWRSWLSMGWQKAGADLFRLVDQLGEAIERARQRRRLMMLDERLLQDIGASPADVWEESRKPFWRC